MCVHLYPHLEICHRFLWVNKKLQRLPSQQFHKDQHFPRKKTPGPEHARSLVSNREFQKGRCGQNFTKAIGISTCVFRAQNQSISTPFPRGRLKILNRICQIQESFQMRPKASNPNFSLQMCQFKIGLFTMIILGKRSSLVQSIKCCCLTILRICKFREKIAT